MKLAAISAVSLLLSSSRGTPLSELNSRQTQGSHYAITGATGGVHPRLEIRELAKTREMWNIFLLALTEFEAMDQNKIDSYYQIAGIHGMPWYDWDGVPFQSSDGKPPKRGYCPHSQLLFGTWHRPYLSLFEQKLQSIALDIASRFPDSTRTSYLTAANELRLPYWDWAQAVPEADPVFPVALSAQKVQVTLPDGSNSEIDNPLFDFDFHPHDNTQINGTGCDVGRPLDQHIYLCNNVTRTVRKAPTPNVNVSDHDAVNKRFRQLLPGIRRDMYPTLTQYRSFNDFSNSGQCGDTHVSSLEYQHNSIHTEMAPGHMVPPAVAAFDPVFWLHHANVDRQMALYQAVFPDTYVDQCAADTATWTIKQDDVLDANSPLTPFHKSANGDWWTSANSRNIADMGYTYPELADNPSNETLVSRINALLLDSPPSKAKRDGSAPANSTAYLAQVDMPMVEGSPYNLLVFLGDVGSDASNWLYEDSFVSKVATISAAAMKGSKPMRGTVVLTDAVEQKVASGTLAADQVVDYLKANLKWRLELADIEIPRKDIPGVKVTLLSTAVEKAISPTEFDRWVGGFQTHGEVDV